jgi:hypothetical protein
MKNRIITMLFASALALPLVATISNAQSALPPPAPVEKDLAAKASNVTEVTLGKNMLSFAAKVMNDKDKDEVATRHLIEGLDGIYVRSYEFDKDGDYSTDQVDQLRKYFETSEWSSIVKVRERKSGESTDVMVKLVDGKSHGLFVLAAEPHELTIVLIMGPINMDDLGKLKGISGLDALGDIDVDGKDKSKAKKGGDQ